MKPTNEYIESLLLKQLHHELSAEEQQLLHIWEASSPVLNSHAFDTPAALKKVREKLQTPESPRLPAGTIGGRRSGSFKWAAGFKWMAAACLLLCGAGWWTIATYRHTRKKTILAADGNRVITLPDSSMVYLRKGSTITYPEASADGRGERDVELEGEAFFEVRPNMAHLFRVTTAQATIEDMGTSFVIRQDETACRVVVTAGTVKCTARTSPAGAIILVAGERALLGAGGWTRQRQRDPNFLSWKTHTLEFNQSPLDSVLAAVQDLYGVPLILSPELAKRSDKIRLTVRFNAHQQLRDVLDEIRLTTGLGMQQQKDTIIFHQK